MARILEVYEEVVAIGRDDGSIMEVRYADLNFDPNVGDFVDIFSSGERIIVAKRTPPPAGGNWNPNHGQNFANPSYGGGYPQGFPRQEGININIQNAPQQQQPYAQAPVYYQSGKVVNKTVYLLLAFFLGGLGIHKFYAGKIGAGIVYVLCSWTFIPSFVAFIEFIVAVFKTADVNGNIVV